MKLLIVEDHEANRFFLTMGFEAEGHDVTSVKNGLEAQASLEQADFDAVLSDYNLPDIDGFEFVSSVVARQNTSGTPKLVIISGATDESLTEKILAAGADRWVSKPFDLDKLIAMVESLIE